MTYLECMKASAAVVRAYGFRDFRTLYRLIIWRGWRAEDGRSVQEWHRIERGFHTAQMLRWAASERGEARAYWVRAAAKRLGPTGLEVWRELPECVRRAA